MSGDDAIGAAAKYVLQMRDKGKSDDEIKAALRARGWGGAALDELWARITPAGPDGSVGREEKRTDDAWQRPGTNVEQQITGPDGGIYVWAPPGEFMMGSEKYRDTMPVHRARITKGFWLGKCQVTNARYPTICNKGGILGRKFPKHSDQGGGHPVVYINWHDAAAYCEHYGLRLPTEAEWEYAARGAKGRTYPWGNRWHPKKCCNIKNKGARERTLPIGSLPKDRSWCGALDMAGNVREWCADWYDEDYYERSPPEDPLGPKEGNFRVLRGGSWAGSVAIHCRCASRSYDYPDVGGHGFRSVASPSPGLD